jgi:hypothetical protein
VRLVADGRLLALADDADPLVLRARFGRGL